MVLRIHIKLKTDLILVFKNVFCSKKALDINFSHLVHGVKCFIEARGTLIQFISVIFILNAEMHSLVTLEAGESCFAIKSPANAFC